MSLLNVIKQPLITEKATGLREVGNKYLFKVDLRADKPTIKQAVEAAFKVNVLSVRTSIVRGKYKRHGRFVAKRSNWKKATVALPAGQKIEFFEGV